jgi:phosphohistidine phosphatase SixA
MARELPTAELPTAAETALLVDHNPGVHEFVAVLSGRELEMKTSTVAVLAWTGSWADADDCGAGASSGMACEPRAARSN